MILSSLGSFLFKKGTSTKRTIAKNLTWLSVAQIATRVIKAFITVYAARVLGAAGYGVFSYAFGLAGFFIFFKNIGIDSILTREIAKKPENEKRYVSTAFWIEFVLLAVTILLVVFVAPLFANIKEALPLLPVIALVLVFDDLRDMAVAFFRGKEEMELEAFVVAFGNIAVTIFGFIALAVAPTPFAFTVAYALASFSGLSLSIALLKKRVREVLRHFDRTLIRPMLMAAWPIAVGGAVSVFLFNVDMVMLGWWRSAAELGLYSASQRIVGILGLFSSLFAVAVFPVFSRLAGEREDSKKAIEISMKALFFIALPLVVGGLVVGNSLVRFVFGPDFAGSVYSFYILLPSILATYPLSILMNFVFAHNKQMHIVPFAVVAAGLNVALNVLLIKRFGIEGAASATLIANVVYTGLLWRYAKSIVHFKVAAGTVKCLCASVLMGSFAMGMQWLHLSVVPVVIASSVFYFVLLFLLRDEFFYGTVRSIMRATRK